MITSKDLDEEKKYLQNVLNILKNEIDTLEGKLKFLSGNIQEQMSYAWDKTNRLSDTEFVYALANIQKRSVFAENANKKINSYKKMLQSAYFARIDFDDGEGVEPIYIGYSSLESDNKFFVYDWRAPISSLFYSSDVGEANYTISTGESIKGKITLKRQYKISGGEIKDIFDTDMQILDNVLISMLSSNAGKKMKNIVNTIQKEQNEIIRKNDVDVLVVQGPAGSGKTSIAMHKLAFLLYNERDKINNSNLMILSPNEIFNNYISSVLPEIGEDNVIEATFFEYAKSFIPELEIVGKLEDIYEIVYSDKKTQNSSKLNEIFFKTGNLYEKMLYNLIQTNRLFLYGIESDIKIEDDVLVSLDEIKKIVEENVDDTVSVYIQGKKVIEKIFVLAAVRTKKTLLLEKLKKETLTSLKNIKTRVLTLYKQLYKDKQEFLRLANETAKACGRSDELSKFNLEQIFDTTKANLDAGKLEYQDVTAYMYFKAQIIGISANNNIKYVLIDEAQDYTLTQYKILSMLFKNSSVTLLGDLSQAILPFEKHKNYNDIVSIVKAQKQNPTDMLCNLEKTYRSTFEINQFAKRVCGINNNYSQIERHGDAVKLTRQDKFNPNEILERAKSLKKSFNTIAIICKNVEETLLYKRANVFADDTFRIVTKNDNVFVEDKIMIIPSYLAKGLEFDAVIVSNLSSSHYSENENQLLYVVLTRALHKLEIYYTDELTKLLGRQ